MRHNEIPCDLESTARHLCRRPRPIRDGEIHGVGKMYWSSYWRDWYEVVREEFECNGVLRYVVCRWSNGNITRHATPLSTTDWELVPV